MVLKRRLMSQGTWQGSKKGTEEVAAHGQASFYLLLFWFEIDQTMITAHVTTYLTEKGSSSVTSQIWVAAVS